MMRHPFTYTHFLIDEPTGERRPVCRFAVIATIEAGLDLDGPPSAQWYISKLSAFALGPDHKPSAEEIEIHGDDPLFDLILCAILREDDAVITEAWGQHVGAMASLPQPTAPAGAALH